MKSSSIGIREAKAQFSRLVSEAEQGAQWVITDRGRPVAKLVPLHDSDLPLQQRLSRLEAWGWIEPLASSGPSLITPPIHIGTDAQRALQEDRDA